MQRRARIQDNSQAMCLRAPSPTSSASVAFSHPSYPPLPHAPKPFTLPPSSSPLPLPPLPQSRPLPSPLPPFLTFSPSSSSLTPPPQKHPSPPPVPLPPSHTSLPCRRMSRHNHLRMVRSSDSVPSELHHHMQQQGDALRCRLHAGTEYCPDILRCNCYQYLQMQDLLHHRCRRPLCPLRPRKRFKMHGLQRRPSNV